MANSPFELRRVFESNEEALMYGWTKERGSLRGGALLEDSNFSGNVLLCLLLGSSGKYLLDSHLCAKVIALVDLSKVALVHLKNESRCT